MRYAQVFLIIVVVLASASFASDPATVSSMEKQRLAVAEASASGPTYVSSGGFWLAEEVAGFELPTEDIEAVQLQDDDKQDCKKRSTCCKVCRKGKACGNSCISRNYSCRKGSGCACNASEICR